MEFAINLDHDNVLIDIFNYYVSVMFGASSTIHQCD